MDTGISEKEVKIQMKEKECAESMNKNKDENGDVGIDIGLGELSD